MTAPEIPLSLVHLVRFDTRYDVDQEVSGVLEVFATKKLADAFIQDLREHWEEFCEKWMTEDNRWGQRFYLTGTPHAELPDEKDLYSDPWSVQYGDSLHTTPQRKI